MIKLRLFGNLAAFLLVASACSDGASNDAGTATQPPATTQAATTTQAPATTQAATTTTPVAVGDPERGRVVWEDGGEQFVAGGCSVCHSLDGSEMSDEAFRAPSWQGISGRAVGRVPGLSAEEYLRQSILEPTAYIVDGYLPIMPHFVVFMSAEEIDDVVAFMLTL